MRRGMRKRILLLAGALLLLAIICWVVEHVRGRAPETENFPVSPLISVLTPDGDIVEIEIEAFLVGVVAAEMPAAFETAALEAQAVAARTYVLRRVAPLGTPKHGAASVCMDSTCCQAYQDEAQRRQKWGDSFAAYEQKIAGAVTRTRGRALYYQGALAEAPFCSTCGGSTEDAADCWSAAVPYLVPVDCAWDAHSPRFTGNRSMTLQEAAGLLEISTDDLRGLRLTASTAGGRVAAAEAGGKTWRGTELRRLLGLDSAAFRWLILGERIVFTSVGYGHGVGLCQYGADGMAKAGYTSAQILSHYYPGVTLAAVSYDDTANGE